MKSFNAFGCTLLIFGLGVLAGILIAPHKGKKPVKY